MQGQTVGAGQVSSPLMVIVKYRRNQRLAELKNIWKWYTIEILGTVQLLNFVWLETADGSYPYAIGVLQESHAEGQEKDSRRDTTQTSTGQQRFTEA